MKSVNDFSERAQTEREQVVPGRLLLMRSPRELPKGEQWRDSFSEGR
jgi:hypothetical protein